MPRLRTILTSVTLLLFVVPPLLVARPARAQDVDGGTKAEAEQAIQAYLVIWSQNADVTQAAVKRFYAPRALYYGHSLSRAQIFADKLAYIRRWPQRSYRELPGSLTTHCNGDRSLCRVSVDMAWQRSGVRTVSGRAHMTFDFVPADGARKIARESARIL